MPSTAAGQYYWQNINRETNLSIVPDKGTFHSPQVYDRFPLLRPLFASFEVEYWPYGEDSGLCLNGGGPSDQSCGPFFFQHGMWIPFAIAAAYVVLLFGGQAVMKSRAKFEGPVISNMLTVWNLLLAVFSLCGAVRTVSHQALSVYDHGVQYSICKRADVQYGVAASGLWTTLFILSKPAELIDTAFLVAKKKDVIFLHWYHHITVMLYCWHSYAVKSSNAMWFVAMNYSVHAAMYFYYFLMSLGIKPRWGMYLTIAQTSQMAVGIAVQVATAVYVSSGEVCDVDSTNIVAGLTMYASYFALFLTFFFQKDYGMKPKRGKAHDE